MTTTSASEPVTGNGKTETSHVKVETGLYQRLSLLAQLGEAYLALETHRARADQCVSHIQNLRAALVDLNQVLQGRAQALEDSRAPEIQSEEVGHV